MSRDTDLAAALTHKRKRVRYNAARAIADQISTVGTQTDQLTQTLETMPQDMKVGPQGLPGPVGPDGSQGSAGPVGPQGEVGPEGQPGPIGPRGLPGPVGPEGSAGANGAEGPVGPVGPTGPAGSRGEMGYPGADGRDGLQGERGPIGPAGPQGASGPVGPAGIPGPTGPGGAAGPIGPAGVAGAGIRTDLYTGTIGSDGTVKITFTQPYANPPKIICCPTLSGIQVVIPILVGSSTVGSCTISAKITKGTLVLNASAFDSAPAGTMVTIIAIG